jgi:nucleoside 2-deoxyribosyltransferase
MLIYLAGKPQDHELFVEYAKNLRDTSKTIRRDFTILSTWHDDATATEALCELQRIREHNRTHVDSTILSMLETGKVRQLTDLQPTAVLEMQLTEFFRKCQHEFENADIVIADVDGGAFEAGYALAKGKLVITFGGILESPVIHDHPNLRSFATWIQAVAHLAGPIGRHRHQTWLRQETARSADTD